MTPRRVIDALLKNEIDVGPLDSYVHDLIKRHEPDTAAKLRTIESTAMTPIPLLIASPGIGDGMIARLRNALLSCHTDPALADTREALLLARFAEVDAADYQALPAQRKKADAAGMPNPSLLG